MVRYRARQALVHGEPVAAPVDAVAECAHLPADRAAGVVLPVPHLLDEQLAAEVLLGLAVDCELLLHHGLGGDAGVVHPGQPQHLVALHPLAPGQRVHQRVVQRMAHVQAAGHVGRRQHHRVWRLAAVGVGGEILRLRPSFGTARFRPPPDPTPLAEPQLLTNWVGRSPHNSREPRRGDAKAAHACRFFAQREWAAKFRPQILAAGSRSALPCELTSCRRAARRGCRRSRRPCRRPGRCPGCSPSGLLPPLELPPRMLPRMSLSPPPLDGAACGVDAGALP